MRSTGLEFIEDLVADVEAQVAAFHEVQDEVEGVSVLECVVHVDDEGGGEVGEEDSLVHDALDAFLGHDSS